MTEQLQQLAREYAEQDIPICDPDVSEADRRDMVDTVADFAEGIIAWLTKSHCIVSREKLEKYDIAHRANSNSWVMLSKEDISDLFGSDLFEKGGVE